MPKDQALPKLENLGYQQALGEVADYLLGKLKATYGSFQRVSSMEAGYLVGALHGECTALVEAYSKVTGHPVTEIWSYLATHQDQEGEE